MKVRNRPGQYVKRSDLSGRRTHAKGNALNQVTPKNRDFSSAEIDENYYFTFRSEAPLK
jgi:hypothetical protein